MDSTVSDALLHAMRTLAPEFVAIRQDIHAHPELAFEERRTSDLVAERLAAWGYQVHRGLGGTGVVGTLRKGSGSRSLGIRADMDALPIQERTGLAYASRHAGKMHACGHDGHTAVLLCAARYLAESADFNGTLNLIFQPAEENEGGALRMVDEGLFTLFPCDEVYALHNSPGLPVGQMTISAGPLMASFDRATVTLRGRGAHGAMPHHGVDPMQCAASITLGLQSIVSREIDALKSAVITVGRRCNVIRYKTRRLTMQADRDWDQSLKLGNGAIRCCPRADHLETLNMGHPHRKVSSSAGYSLLAIPATLAAAGVPKGDSK